MAFDKLHYPATTGDSLIFGHTSPCVNVSFGLQTQAMEQESSSARSPRDQQSRSSASDDDFNTSLYPFDDLTTMTDESSVSSTDVLSTTTGSNTRVEKLSTPITHSSRSTFSDSSMEKEVRRSPRGLRTNNLRRRSIHKNYPEGRYEQTTPMPKEESVMPKKDSGMRLCIIIFPVVMIIIIVNFVFSPVAEESAVKEKILPELIGRELMVKHFNKYFEDVRSEFPSQTKRFWATVSGSSKSVLKTETPSQPGILLLVALAEGKQTMRCLAQRISELLMKVYSDNSVTVFHVDDHLNLNGSQLKLEIDKTFQSGLGTRHEHVAVLHNLEKVSGRAAMMFHGYCDNESAPFKDAVIIFTMEVLPSEDSMMSMKEREVEELAESRLQAAWETDIGYDNAMALRSRVANNIGVVRAESALKAIC